MIERVIGIDQHGNYEWTGQEFPTDSPEGTSTFSDMLHGRIRWKFTNNIRSRVSKEMYEKYYAGAVTCAVQVPIKVDSGRIIGIIAADNLFTHRRLRKAELFSLLNFATQAGMAIESFRLHQQIKDLTNKDALTGVYNRRFFDNFFPREVLRCRRYKRYLSLLYVDLDHFKEINDSHGHPAGDLVLKQVAQRLILGLRNVDLVVRMGGDEFAVILPEVGLEGAKNVADRLFKAITGTPIPLETLGFPGRKIGISMGMACFSETLGDHEDLLRLADVSLYQAKSAGRNRVGAFALNQA